MNIDYVCMNVILVNVLRSVHWIHTVVLELIQLSSANDWLSYFQL
jgi:hypothetical protein